MKHSTALRYLHAINMNICAMNTRFIYKAIILTAYRSTEQSLFSFYEHSMLPEI